MLSHPGETPEYSNQFQARMIWMSDDTAFPGRSYLLKIGAQLVPATITDLKFRTNVNTLEQSPARTLELNEVGTLTIATDKPSLKELIVDCLKEAKGKAVSVRQLTEESQLLEAIGKVLKAQRVEGLLTIAYVKQTERRTQYVGRGRGSANRDKRVIEKGRYQITQVTRHDDQVADLKASFGWKAFVSNATEKRLSLSEAVLCYRHEYRIERIFHRLKSRLPIAPMFAKRDDQIQGLTYLLT